MVLKKCLKVFERSYQEGFQDLGSWHRTCSVEYCEVQKDSGGLSADTWLSKPLLMRFYTSWVKRY